MGMTIDNHIEVLKSYHNGFTEYAGNLQDSIDMAIDTMRKYKQIEKIVNKWHQDPEVKDFDCMAEVADVFEEGGEPLWYQATDLD